MQGEATTVDEIVLLNHYARLIRSGPYTRDLHTLWQRFNVQCRVVSDGNGGARVALPRNTGKLLLVAVLKQYVQENDPGARVDIHHNQSFQPQQHVNRLISLIPHQLLE
jgi:hypothetical protein